MCGANKRFFLYLLLALLFVSVAGALRGEEQEAWYLISEGELQSIEQHRNSREAERQSWLSQAQELKTQAAGLQRESKALNEQLAFQQERTRMLQWLFNKYEAENLTTISMKNGEIAGLEQLAAARTLEAAKWKGVAHNRLIVIVALTAAWIILIAFRMRRFFKAL
jgi:hypothetical protein